MRTVPIVFDSVALASSFGLTRSPIAFIISPAMMSSGRKYSFSSKRLPTMVIASLAASRIIWGSSPASSMARTNSIASSSFMSAMAVTRFSFIASTP
jgi:hypothetical protein